MAKWFYGSGRKRFGRNIQAETNETEKMLTKLYLLNHSFRYVKGITVEEIEDKIMSLSPDYDFIKKNGDLVYRHDSIYDEEIYPDLPLYEFLYNSEKGAKFNRDIRRYLQKIIDHSSKSTLNIGEIIELLNDHDENNIYGLICLHKIDFIDEKFLIYNKNEWLSFHRYFLGIYPLSETHFYDESDKYFPNLFFHNIIKSSLRNLEGGLFIFSKTIISILTALNDIFPKHFKANPVNLLEILKSFSSDSSIKTTLEGNINRKENLSFVFDYKDSKSKKICKEKICCESHMKLGKSDNYSGDSRYYYNRIYFHPGKPHLHQGKVLVCHIGKHL